MVCRVCPANTPPDRSGSRAFDLIPTQHPLLSPNLRDPQRMGLLSVFRRTDQSPVPPATTEASDAVREARMRARRRLIGAVVLLVIGVIGFPLVFETQPRPIPVDIPIEIPKKDGAPALVMPPARPAADTAQSPAAPIALAPAAPSAETITESRSDAGREV
ncbi:MAG: hypothetical protein ACREXI_09930, partial [Caldimonas sp.]